MSVGKLTKRDLKHLLEEYNAQIAEPGPEEYDGPIDVMTSLGYVLLWSDGDVSMHGEVIANVLDD